MKEATLCSEPSQKNHISVSKWNSHHFCENVWLHSKFKNWQKNNIVLPYLLFTSLYDESHCWHVDSCDCCGYGVIFHKSCNILSVEKQAFVTTNGSFVCTQKVTWHFFSHRAWLGNSLFFEHKHEHNPNLHLYSFQHCLLHIWILLFTLCNL